jgi:hypothetical protein
MSCGVFLSDNQRGRSNLVLSQGYRVDALSGTFLACTLAKHQEPHNRAPGDLPKIKQYRYA